MNKIVVYLVKLSVKPLIAEFLLNIRFKTSKQKKEI